MCSALKPVSLTSAPRTWLSNGLYGFRKIESILGCFLSASCDFLWVLPLMYLVMSAQPWCSMLMSLLHNVQYKLCSVFFGWFFCKKNLNSVSENHSSLALQTFLAFLKILLLKSAKTNNKNYLIHPQRSFGYIKSYLDQKRNQRKYSTFWKIQLSKLEFNF